jgi:rRNA maturation protein Rpf1
VLVPKSNPSCRQRHFGVDLQVSMPISFIFIRGRSLLEASR